jgi:hypothetical protein
MSSRFASRICLELSLSLSQHLPGSFGHSRSCGFGRNVTEAAVEFRISRTSILSFVDCRLSSPTHTNRSSPGPLVVVRARQDALLHPYAEDVDTPVHSLHSDKRKHSSKGMEKSLSRMFLC